MGVDRPVHAVAQRLGRPRTTDLREIMNAILYMATTGYQWIQLPKDLPVHVGNGGEEGIRTLDTISGILP